MASILVAEQLRQLPANPGVYLMKDAEANILYVGKAVDLRQRVKSYFVAGQKLTPKTQRLVSLVNDIDFFVTNSEQEALVLELNLIKRHRPPYNVRLKDDKTFPYLKIDPGEDWPGLCITRRLEEDGGHYFGPFASSKSVRQALKMLRGIFPFRTCSGKVNPGKTRACLEYHLGRCLGPCIGTVSRQEYAEIIKEIILFLEGKQQRVVRELRARMKKAAEALDFEKAALLRDQVQAVEAVVEGQRIATRVKGEQDVIAFAENGDQAYVQVFFVRRGQLVGREGFVLQGTRAEEPSGIMASFIKQFYSAAPHIPPLLLLQHPVEDIDVISLWLQGKKGGRVDIQVPSRGSKKQLVNIVAENARYGLEQLKIKQLATPAAVTAALDELKKELQLPDIPFRMEGYDISNIQGVSAVGSMVVFEEGKPVPADYRRFRIKTVPGADDYAMLREVLRRRFQRYSTSDASTTDAWAVLPDLVLIDGGKGQLSAALAAMREMGRESIAVASLAKAKEEIFIPQRSGPIVLPAGSPGLQLLQRLRDEAHRFALGYHQKLHMRGTMASALDTISGIGPKRKRQLLRQFGSVQAIREASTEELAATGGISQSLARKIKEYL